MAPKKISYSWSLAVLAGIASLTIASAAEAQAPRVERHPRNMSMVRKPVGVPENYVLTRNGFFHPSCVIRMGSDEIWGDDMMIRGLDGKVHDQITPCGYPRFDREGSVIVTELKSMLPPPSKSAPDLTDLPTQGRLLDLSETTRPTSHRPHDTYDGWLVFYDYAGKLDTGSSLSTKWVVPALPSKVGGQDVAFFNDFETNAIILQPVLDFGEMPGQWVIESENCCPNNNDMQSTLVPVSPGDTIVGTVTAKDCNASGVCSTWTVTTKDLDTGKSTVLNTNASGEAASEINPAVLETYDVTSCDMLPANGEITFFENVLDDANGNHEPLKYTLNDCVTGDCGGSTKLPSSFPTDCGFGGTTSSNSYTLKFGKSPTAEPANDGGSDTDAGVTDPDASAIGTDAGSSSGSSNNSGSSSSGSSGTSDPNSNGPDNSDTDAGDGGGATDSDAPSSSSGCATAPGSRTSWPGSAFIGIAGAIALMLRARRKSS